MRRAAVVLALAGCHIGSQSTIGPYARSIRRQGGALAVEMCMIHLRSDELRGGECHVELVPLPRAAPAQPSVGRSTATPIAW